MVNKLLLKLLREDEYSSVEQPLGWEGASGLPFLVPSPSVGLSNDRAVFRAVMVL